MQTGGAFSGFQLPTAQAPSSFSPGAILSSYNASHAASRNSNQQLFDKTSAAFDRILAGQQQDLAGVGDQYRARQRAVVRGLSGANAANLRDIAKQFTAMSGDAAQTLIDRGLGNSTIQQSVQRGIGNSYADARTRSQNDFAKSIADLRTKWGMAAMQQAQQAAMANSGLAQQQAQFLMANTNIGYPDLGAFMQAAQMGMGGGGAPGGGGGGGLIMGDMSRPVGGPGPQGAWAYTTGGGDEGSPSSGVNLYSQYAVARPSSGLSGYYGADDSSLYAATPDDFNARAAVAGFPGAYASLGQDQGY